MSSMLPWASTESSLVLKGPFSVSRPIRELEPGPGRGEGGSAVRVTGTAKRVCAAGKAELMCAAGKAELMRALGAAAYRR